MPDSGPPQNPHAPSFSPPPARRKRAVVSLLGSPQLHLRNPLVTALWSAIFPGFGHFLISRYLSGMLLFIWEVIVNLNAHVNLAIYYTFTGDIETAKSVLDITWLLLYVPTYLFAIWDSYRATVDMNHHFVLADREDALVKPFHETALGFATFDKSTPWAAALWSALSPGVGQLISRRTLMAFFLLAWWIVVAVSSKLLPAIHHTVLGQFDLAREAADKQWILNVPSMVFFSIYDAYTGTVEANKLFTWELSRFLRHSFQPKAFPMPFAGRKESSMYLIANFQPSIHVEMAVTELIQQGVDKADILAVPLNSQQDQHLFLDKLHASDHASTLDIPMIFAATLSLFGLIYGFVLPLGPILWALFGTGAGFLLGLAIKWIAVRIRNQKRRSTKPEVVLMVACVKEKAEAMQQLLFRNGALGVSALMLGEHTPQ